MTGDLKLHGYIRLGDKNLFKAIGARLKTIGQAFSERRYGYGDLREVEISIPRDAISHTGDNMVFIKAPDGDAYDWSLDTVQGTLPKPFYRLCAG